jgi:hypothetical protein
MGRILIYHLRYVYMCYFFFERFLHDFWMIFVLMEDAD